jgi:hypothetical protein
MTHTNHHQSDSEGRTSGGDLRGPYWKRAHQDWKFWIAIVLMLTAMGIYIVTLDLSVQPNVGNKLQQQVP